MTVVGIIPARGSSKRLPAKNLRQFAGSPLIAQTCEAARNAGVLTACYVSTDSPEIASVARFYGVPTPVLRPAQLARDESPTFDAVRHLLEHLAQRGERYDAVMILQPTSPLRTAADIQAAWNVFETQAPCAVVSVSPVAPDAWLGRLRPDGQFERGVGADWTYRLNGAIYIHCCDDYLAQCEPRKTVAYIMPPERSVDIDTRADFDYAAHLFEQQHALAGALVE